MGVGWGPEKNIFIKKKKSQVTLMQVESEDISLKTSFRGLLELFSLELIQFLVVRASLSTG